MICSTTRKEAILMKYRPTKEERSYSEVDERILRRYIRQLLEDLSLKQLQRILHVIDTMKGV
jgi:hypothetical protein